VSLRGTDLQPNGLLRSSGGMLALSLALIAELIGSKHAHLEGKILQRPAIRLREH
jgi:hypothetical protein